MRIALISDAFPPLRSSGAIQILDLSLELLKQNVYAKETHKSTIRIAPSLTINAVQIDQIAEAINSVITDL